MIEEITPTIKEFLLYVPGNKALKNDKAAVYDEIMRMKKVTEATFVLPLVMIPLFIVLTLGEIRAESRFETFVSGMVRDTKSGLDWYAGPDKNTSWDEAKSWTENLRIYGGGWRMPTRAELKSLYQKGAGSRNMTPLMRNTGWFVWTVEGWTGQGGGDGKAWAVDFGDGREVLESRNSSYYKRAFAVRLTSDTLTLTIDPAGYSIAVVTGRATHENLTAVNDPELAGNIIVGFDSRFDKFGNGVVYDKKSGLEWYAGPDENTSQAEARVWANSLRVDGGGWRMPTLKELKGLYQKGTGARNMTPLLETTGWWIWSGEGNMPGPIWALDFSDGREFTEKRDSSNYKRGFAVRSRK